MNALDYAALIIVVMSVLLSMFRGLVFEVLSLASWIGAALLANRLSVQVAQWVPFDLAGARVLVAYGAVFIFSMLVLGMVAVLASRAVRALGLAYADRSLGALFGLARGLVILLIIVLLVGFTRFPRTPLWRASLLAPPLESAIMLAKPWLPERLVQHIQY
jgi:membrane protein required for colicin V production